MVCQYEHDGGVDVLGNKDCHCSVDVAVLLVLCFIEFAYPVQGYLKKQVDKRNKKGQCIRLIF